VKQSDTKKAKDYKLRSRYGITLAEYDDMLQRQQGKCAICKRPATDFKKALSVDHNHVTGFCRGLLCDFCNSKLLKFLRDNKKLAYGLVEYLTDAFYADIDWEE